MSHTIATRPNADLIDQKYSDWKKDPDSVDASWAMFFEGFELGLVQPVKHGKSDLATTTPVGDTSSLISSDARIVTLIRAFRSLGHTAAWLDPLDDAPPIQPELSLEYLGIHPSEMEQQVATPLFGKGEPIKLRDLVDRLRRIYCGKIGYEFMHIQVPEMRNWLMRKIEASVDRIYPSIEEKKLAFKWLAQADLFEKFLHKKFVGQKRFSLEGGDALIVALRGLVQLFSRHDIDEMVMGMAHRGRLNVLANHLGKPLSMLFYEFSDNYVPNLVAGDGDVKYHLGFASEQEVEGRTIQIQLAANPSHLEAVNSVVEGAARASQRSRDSKKRDSFIDRSSVLPVLIHGDAAFAGQGSVMETLNLSQLKGYRTGGTVHIVVNNQVGFTTTTKDARSTAYCTDIAKMVDAPIFHVNGDYPLEVLYVTGMALEFRQRYGRDVVVDIVCYRRHGHNEGDEPAFTLPDTYREIRQHPTPREIFRRRLIEAGDITDQEADEIEGEYQARLQAEVAELERAIADGTDHLIGKPTEDPQPEYSHVPVETGVDKEVLRKIGTRISEIRGAVRVDPKLETRFLKYRHDAILAGEGINWAFGEALAFGALLQEGIAVRLSGQDCRRGTFSQRHAVLYDPETRQRYTPLNHLSARQKAKLWVFNSHLSEFAVLGYEYGYTQYARDILVLWEAQFGDFANGAQVIIDQFIASAESKWGKTSSLVMLLPHGYEGQGPEHSSARLERYLQLCADDNIQVCNTSTPAQYYHVLRRQMKRDFVKPLILMTPKSLLTHPECVSKLDDFATGTHFEEILDDSSSDRGAPDRIARLIFCSGKVYYDLLDYRRKNEITNVALIRLEQLYPFHAEKLVEIAARYPNAKKWVWCQEEPQNMGAWTFIGPRLQSLSETHVRYAGRDCAASPASGSKAIHKTEQHRLIEEAFSN